ncbi:hypothetical protein MBCUT_06550 [Methanobrevibacter cuticularis]|uniref:Uncharacterized protein n=1 Tax=Methanobrevibacter cuticularis TaxID=47311 RepID=A0A166CT37_9EURY|nr:hypothetical protein [Methanobrevibacter cuticularis]KZX16617.1 hypothetical protein MBCUT_06550 [Methanobrevibacter cuticularis]
MSFKKAFKRIFKIYDEYESVSHNQLIKIADVTKVNFEVLESACLAKGLI